LDRGAPPSGDLTLKQRIAIKVAARKKKTLYPLQEAKKEDQQKEEGKKESSGAAGWGTSPAARRGRRIKDPSQDGVT